MVCKKNRTRVHNSAHDHIITPLNLFLGGPRQGRRHSSLTEKNQNVSQKKKRRKLRQVNVIKKVRTQRAVFYGISQNLKNTCSSSTDFSQTPLTCWRRRTKCSPRFGNWIATIPVDFSRMHPHDNQISLDASWSEWKCGNHHSNPEMTCGRAWKRIRDHLWRKYREDTSIELPEYVYISCQAGAR